MTRDYQREGVEARRGPFWALPPQEEGAAQKKQRKSNKGKTVTHQKTRPFIKNHEE